MRKLSMKEAKEYMALATVQREKIRLESLKSYESKYHYSKVLGSHIGETRIESIGFPTRT